MHYALCIKCLADSETKITIVNCQKWAIWYQTVTGYYILYRIVGILDPKKPAVCFRVDKLTITATLAGRGKQLEVGRQLQIGPATTSTFDQFRQFDLQFQPSIITICKINTQRYLLVTPILLVPTTY